jgi:hypothetical protein
MTGGDTAGSSGQIIMVIMQNKLQCRPQHKHAEHDVDCAVRSGRFCATMQPLAQQLQQAAATSDR